MVVVGGVVLQDRKLILLLRCEESFTGICGLTCSQNVVPWRRIRWPFLHDQPRLTVGGSRGSDSVLRVYLTAYWAYNRRHPGLNIFQLLQEVLFGSSANE